jgi:hypothetical protein
VLKRLLLALVVILVLIVGAAGFYTYAFTTKGIPAGTCPEFSFVAGTPNMPFKILSIEGTSRLYQGSGPISWCIYGAYNLLIRSYQTNRILNTPVVSGNGEYVVASGLEIAPGPAGVYTNGAIYLFDKTGRMLWSVTDSNPFFASLINNNGSVVVGSGTDLYYINNQGMVLWNYSNPNKQSFTVALLNNGSYVVDGITNVLFPDRSNYGSSLVMFDSRGQVVWNDSIYDQQFGGASTLAVSSGYIAAGVASSGWNGTLHLYSLNGSEIWSRAVDSDILNVNFQNSGTAIYLETNWGHVIFNTKGNVIENVTAPH